VKLQKELHYTKLVAEKFQDHVDRLVEIGVAVDYDVEYVIDDVIERFYFLREPWKPLGRLKDIGIDVDLEPKSFDHLVDRIIERIHALTNVEDQPPSKESNPPNSQPCSVQVVDHGLRRTSPLNFSNMVNNHDADPEYGSTPALPPAALADVLPLHRSASEPSPSTEMNAPVSAGTILQMLPSTHSDTHVFPCPVLLKPHEPCLGTFQTRDEVKRHILGSHVTFTPYSISAQLPKPNDASL